VFLYYFDSADQTFLLVGKSFALKRLYASSTGDTGIVSGTRLVVLEHMKSDFILNSYLPSLHRKRRLTSGHLETRMFI